MNITKKKVQEKIKKLRMDAVAGLDKIGPRLLKELADVVSFPPCNHNEEICRDWTGPHWMEGGKCYPYL